MDPNKIEPAAVKCVKCGQNTAGYKCDMCGAESAEHDDSHPCGGAHCVTKCAVCNEAETKCTCPPAMTA